MIDNKNKETPIITICYGKEKKWKNRKDAITFFLKCVISSDGSEQERYRLILDALLKGKLLCSDEMN